MVHVRDVRVQCLYCLLEILVIGLFGSRLKRVHANRTEARQLLQPLCYRFENCSNIHKVRAVSPSANLFNGHHNYWGTQLTNVPFPKLLSHSDIVSPRLLGLRLIISRLSVGWERAVRPNTFYPMPQLLSIISPILTIKQQLQTSFLLAFFHTNFHAMLY